MQFCQMSRFPGPLGLNQLLLVAYLFPLSLVSSHLIIGCFEALATPFNMMALASLTALSLSGLYWLVAQQRISCSLVLKVKKWAALFFPVLTGIYNTVYRAASALFKKYTRYFFNATHQVKAIAIGIVEANPLVENGDCCSCVHLHVFFPTNPQNRYKGLSLNTHFYIAL